MMLFTFAKKDGNVIRIGAECDVPQPLQEVMMPYSDSGFDLASAEEWDKQMLGQKVEECVVPVEDSKLPGESSATE